MARIFKPRYPKMRIVRGPDGKPIMETRVAKRGPRKGQSVRVPTREAVVGRDGQRVYTEAKSWAIEYTDAGGRQRSAGGYTDKLATSEKASKIEKAVARQREGIFGADVSHADTSVEKHVAAWVADLKRAGRSSEYTRKVEARVERMRKELTWGKPSSIRADKVTEWIAGLQRSGASDRTVNHFVEAAVAFCNWTVSQGRMETNPLRQVSKAETPEPKRQRRALTLDELERLVGVHPTRGPVYLTAALTGLRRAELAALQWGDVRLDTDRPCIALRASTTKSRRADTVALNDEIADKLRGMRPSTWQATGPVFASIPKSSTFLTDLDAAGIARTIDGKAADLHSLRVTHNTMLATSGVSIREAMEQMRHTDIRLTTKVYTDPRLLNLHAAVNRLPRVVSGERERQVQRATGTYDAVSDIRSDIRKELSAPVRKGSKTPFPVSVRDTNESAGNTLKQGISCTSEQWRRGESNPRPATAFRTLLRA